MDKAFHWIKNEIASLLIAASLVAVGLFLLSLKKDTEKIKSLPPLLLKGTLSPQKGVQYNYVEGTQAEINLMSSLMRKEQITLFGSSEFTDSPFAPYHFLPDSLGIPAMGFGHAHHQLFAIYCELLAANEFLPGSKICILISPGWFEKPGTNTEAFLEFVPENFMKRIWLNSELVEEKKYVGKYISTFADDFSSLSSVMYNLSMNYRKNQRFSPIAKIEFLLNSKLSINQKSIREISYSIQESNLLNRKNYDFQSQLLRLKNVAKKSFSNNSICVDSSYYATYLIDANGKYTQGSVDKVDLSNNQEYRDFIVLLNFLKKRGVEASFIIQPLNPFHYKNIESLEPTITALTKKLDEAKFPYLNMYVTDKAKYTPGTLSDVMHLGDLGWMKINQFLVNTYAK